MISAGHFCRLNMALHPVVNQFSKDDMVALRMFCQNSIINPTVDMAICLDQNVWPSTTLNPTKLNVTC